jgi:hypothetical protein
MTHALRWLDLALLLLIWSVSTLIAQSSFYAASPHLMGPAIAADLIVTALAVHWLVGLRLGGLPSWTVAIVVLGGAALTSVLVPDQTGLVLVLAGLAELTALGVALARGRRFVSAMRTARAAGRERGDALEAGLAEALEAPRLASAVRLEIEVFWLSITGWFRKPRVPEGATAFTHHVGSSWMVVAAVLIGVSIAEGAALHVILRSTGHPNIALGLAALHVYAIIWVMGDIHGLRLRPSLVDASSLHLRVGLRWTADIHRLRILHVGHFAGEADESHLSLHVLGDPNVLLRLDAPVEVRGPFGIRRPSVWLLLQVDDPERFTAALDGSQGLRGDRH